jgi:hypothetical protein
MNLEMIFLSSGVVGRFWVAHLKITAFIPLKECKSQGYLSILQSK